MPSRRCVGRNKRLGNAPARTAECCPRKSKYPPIASTAEPAAAAAAAAAVAATAVAFATATLAEPPAAVAVAAASVAFATATVAIATASLAEPPAAAAVAATAVAFAAAAVALAPVALAAASADNALFRRVPCSLVGTWRPVREKQILPRWSRRGRRHGNKLRVWHGLHRLRAALHDAATVAAADAAAAAAVDAAVHASRNSRLQAHERRPLVGRCQRRLPGGGPAAGDRAVRSAERGAGHRCGWQ